MRIVTFLLFTLLITATIQAQVPSKAEMQQQMAGVIQKLAGRKTELENQIAEARKNKEPQETIKPMEDELAMLNQQINSMGGLTSGLSRMSDKTIKKGIEQSDNENSDLAPKRDVARINALPKKTMTDAELVVFLHKVNIAIENKLPALQKKHAIELYDEVNAKGKSPTETGNIAVLCWLGKSTDMAIWILGKACMDDPSNTDNLNNYSSLLSMIGGEHLAIPIQQNLLAKFPNNSTLMNNLGQSWYGLGDLTNSKKYLGGNGMLLAAHPYAQETICGIDEAEGKSNESIEALKTSIKEDYTPEKEAKLTRLGYHLKYEDVGFKYPTKAQPLGIEKFLSHPGYSSEGGEAAQINQMEWDDYREKIAVVVSALQQTKIQIDDKVDKYRQKLVGDLPSQNIKSYKQVDVAALAGRVSPLLEPYNNKIYKTAKRKYDLLIEWHTDRFIALTKKIYESDAMVEQYRNDFNLAISNAKTCEARFAAASTFNSKANGLWQERNAELLTLEKEFLNARANYTLYASLDPSIYEQDILNIKLEILDFLSALRHENEVGCIPPKDIPKPEGKTLPDFDEINCQYKTELSIPHAESLFSIKVECNKMTTKFDAKYVKGSLEENLANGKYKGNVEIQVKVGKDMAPFGPIDYIEHVLNPVGPEGPFQAGTEVKAGAGVDFTEGGIQDIYVTGKVGVKAGITGVDGPVPSSVSLSSIEAKMSVITGQGSITGKGAFSGISIK